MDTLRDVVRDDGDLLVRTLQLQASFCIASNRFRNAAKRVLTKYTWRCQWTLFVVGRFRKLTAVGIRRSWWSMAPVYTIYNLSSDTLSISRPARRSPTIVVVAPNSHTKVELPIWTKLTLSVPLTQASTKPTEKSPELPEHVFFRLRKGMCMKSWKLIKLPPETRWQVYIMKVSRAFIFCLRRRTR
jgi:hypothetical protein